MSPVGSSAWIGNRVGWRGAHERSGVVAEGVEGRMIEHPGRPARQSISNNARINSNEVCATTNGGAAY